jgi:RNA-directed DNA polymerase
MVNRLGKKRPITEEDRREAAQHGWEERSRIPLKLADLRLKLFLKAKREQKFRFYSLYDRVFRKDVLRTAWELVRANKGAPGIDGVTIDQIVHAKEGPESLVDALHEELRARTYRPRPVRRVYIPKPDGSERPLGIPAVRDRVAQMAVKLILEPIFEADFLDCSYGFRPRRKAHDALDEIHATIVQGRGEVFDADLKGYFDSIPRDKLLSALRMRVTDSSVLKLIRLWLDSPVVDAREGGPPRRSRKGTPQGGVISPLLANVYLHWFDRFFHERSGPAHWAKATLVRYADDFVVLAKYQGDRLREWIRQTLEDRMGLELHPEKTQVVRLKEPKASFDFLGFTFRYVRSPRGYSSMCLQMAPSKKSLAKERASIREMTATRYCFMPIPALIAKVNRQTKGWAGYFRHGFWSEAMHEVNFYLFYRMKRHLCRRSQRPFRPSKGVTYYQHLRRMGMERV